MNFEGVLGHEFVGTVVQVFSSEAEELLGQRVCGDINLPCKSCHICTWDHSKDSPERHAILARNHCPQRTVLGILNKQGSMAQYLTLPVSNLHRVPPRIPDRIAVFAEPLAAALRIVEQNIIQFPRALESPPSKVAILGDGKLGLMIANVVGRIYLQQILYECFPRNINECASTDEIKTILKDLSTNIPWIQNHKPILIGKHPQKMDLFKYPLVYDDTETQGSLVQLVPLSECIDNTAWNGVSHHYSSHFDVVIDATGSPDGLSFAAKLCQPMGTLVLKSTCATGTSFNTAPFVIDELNVIGSRCGPIDRALDFLNCYYDAATDDNPLLQGQGDQELTNPTQLLRKLAPFRVESLIHGNFPLKVCMIHGCNLVFL